MVGKLFGKAVVGEWVGEQHASHSDVAATLVPLCTQSAP
jgi:hypothetical protein